MNEIVKPKSLLDGFQGFEGVDSPANRLIQGQRGSRPGRSRQLDAKNSRRAGLRRGQPVRCAHENAVRYAPTTALRD